MALLPLLPRCLCTRVPPAAVLMTPLIPPHPTLPLLPKLAVSAGSFQEPPANAEELMGPGVVAVYPQVAAAIDMDLADAAVCQALKVRRGGWLGGQVSGRVVETASGASWQAVAAVAKLI